MDREMLAARAIVRTLRACGDEEKQERFVGHVLRDHAWEVESLRATVEELRKLSHAKHWR